MSKFKNIANYIKKHGVSFTIRELYLRMKDKSYENYFKVGTGTTREDIKDGQQEKETGVYGTMHYSGIFSLFSQLPDPVNETTMIDYGCGKGRVIVAAASSNFKKIIGIDFSPLVHIAQTNLEEMKHRKTKDIDLLAQDARHYIIPPEVNLIYFYNPFTGSILQTVIDNIRLSFQKHPRKISIIYVNHDHFEKCIAGQSWIKKKKEGKLMPDNSYGIYEIN